MWDELSDFLPKSTEGIERGGGNNLTAENYDKHCLSSVITISPAKSQIIMIVCTLDMMWWKWHFTSVIFFPKIHNPSLILRKTSEKFQQKNSNRGRDILQSDWSVLLKTVTVITSKESLRNRHTQLVAKGNRTTKCNTVAGWDPGTEKSYWVKTKEIWINCRL